MNNKYYMDKNFLSNHIINEKEVSLHNFGKNIKKIFQLQYNLISNKNTYFFIEEWFDKLFFKEQIYILSLFNALFNKKILNIHITDVKPLLYYFRNFEIEDLQDWQERHYKDDFLYETGTDLLNFGMRMRGRRWLHDAESLKALLIRCGFVVQNKGSETDPVSDGMHLSCDASKKRAIQRIVVQPSLVANAERTETVRGDIALYRATTSDPIIEYTFPEQDLSRLVLVNVCSSVLSSQAPASAAFYFASAESAVFPVDRSLHSNLWMNLCTGDEARKRVPGQSMLRHLRFDPVDRKGAMFTVGPLELFVFAPPVEADKRAGEKAFIEVSGETRVSKAGLAVHTSIAACRYGSLRHYDFDRPIADALGVYGEWAQQELELLFPYIHPAGTVIDVGAHVGNHTLAFARRVGMSGRVLSLEPQPELFALLVRNVADNDLRGVVTPLHAAAGAEEGEVFIPPLQDVTPQNRGAISVTSAVVSRSVRSVTLDAVAPSSVDLIKIDAEKSQFSVLEGARNILAESRPVVMLEAEHALLSMRCLTLLHAMGYTTFYCRCSAYNPANFRFASRDIFDGREEGALICIPSERLAPSGDVPPPAHGEYVASFERLLPAMADTRSDRWQGWDAAAVAGLLAAFRSQHHCERADALYRRLMLQEKRLFSLVGAIHAGNALEKLEQLLQNGETRDGIPGAACKEQRSVTRPCAEDWAVAAAHVSRKRAAPLVDVVIPVYNAADHALRCIHDVLVSTPSTPYRLLVINDASTDEELNAMLRQLAGRGFFELREHEENLGFVRTANEGLRASDDRDVVLLNSDANVCDAWLDALRDKAWGGERVASVTPLSNNAAIYSYPRLGTRAPETPLRADEIHALAARVNGGKSVEIPTAVGFCMYIRRDAVREVGVFDPELFGKGYGEENDFCMKALHAGWKHLLALDCYVWHEGERSFGEGSEPLKARALQTLDRLYPEYRSLIDDYCRRQPALPAYRALDLACFDLGGQRDRPLLLVAHNLGGGVERQVRAMVRRLGEENVSCLILRPVEGKQSAVSLTAPGTPYTDSFELPREMERLLDMLEFLHVRHVHVHCLAGYHAAMPDMIRLLCAVFDTPYDVTAHELLPVCPKAHAVRGDGTYCGVAEAWDCPSCLAADPPWTGGVDVVRWRERYRIFMRRARQVYAPSLDACLRLEKLVPGCSVKPRPNLELCLPQPATAFSPRRPGERLRIAVLGAIGPHKGFHILLACARDAVVRGLPLEFTVIGYSCDDAALQEQGVRITGRYEEEEVYARISDARPHIAFLPAIWPETYSFTLSIAGLAGLYPVVFGLGAQHERIQKWGWGRSLAPALMQDAGAVNDALLACSPAPPPLQVRQEILRGTDPGQNYASWYYGVDVFQSWSVKA